MTHHPALDHRQQNLHNHTLFSDGTSSINELCIEALRTGIQLLGITDHLGTTKCASVSMEELPVYVERIRREAARFLPPSSPEPAENEASTTPVEMQITTLEPGKHLILLAGAEIDFCPDRTDFDFDWDLLGRLDYVLVEHVNERAWDGAGLGRFITFAERARQAGLRVGLAHTDIAGLFNQREQDILVSAMDRLEIFIEISGRKRYSINGIPYHMRASAFFERLSRMQGSVSVGLDVHGGRMERADLDAALGFASSLGLDDSFVKITPRKGVGRGSGKNS